MWVSALIVVVGMVMQPIPTLPSVPVPTAIPTSTPMATMSADDIPRNAIYTFLATAAANVNSLPDDISAPGGAVVLPNVDARQVFAYGKWLFSINTVQELLGITFSPVGLHLFAIFTLIVILASIYLVVNLVVLLIKGIVWIVQQVLRVVPFIG